MAAKLPAVVLMGHDVLAAATPPPEREYNTVINAATLEASLQQIQDQGYRFLDLDEFMRWRNRGGVALLTFDDAYRSVVGIGLPVLQRLGIPALIFAVTGSVLGRGDPFPHFLHVLQENWPRGTMVSNHPLVAKVVATTSFASLGELFAHDPEAAHGIFERALCSEELDTLSAHIAASIHQPRQTMTLLEIVDSMRSGLLTYGAHSITHRALTALNPLEAEREIIRSTEAIAEVSGKPPSEIAFAYPYGFVTAHAASTVARVSRAGFTCSARAVNWMDRAATLPRINLDHQTPIAVRRARSAMTSLGSLQETALLYARTNTGRRLTAPLRRILRAVRAQ